MRAADVAPALLPLQQLLHMWAHNIDVRWGVSPHSSEFFFCAGGSALLARLS
jgi:hypothetical protein